MGGTLVELFGKASFRLVPLEPMDAVFNSPTGSVVADTRILIERK